MSFDYKKTQNIDIENGRVSELNIKVENFFDNERSKWNTELQELHDILHSNKHEDFIRLQSKCLSIRQMIQESITKYMNKLSKENAKYRKYNADRFEFYMTGFGLKTGAGDKKILIDRDLTESKHNVELIESHIEYLRECRISCDQIQFAVKNAIALLNYLG